MDLIGKREPWGGGLEGGLGEGRGPGFKGVKQGVWGTADERCKWI